MNDQQIHEIVTGNIQKFGNFTHILFSSTALFLWSVENRQTFYR